MGEIVFHREEHTTDDIWITKSSAMKASNKSTANVKQGRDSMNKLPPNSTWQKYHLWFMFEYMNFGRAYYFPVLLISEIQLHNIPSSVDVIEKHYAQDNFPYLKDIF